MNFPILNSPTNDRDGDEKRNIAVAIGNEWCAWERRPQVRAFVPKTAPLGRASAAKLVTRLNLPGGDAIIAALDSPEKSDRRGIPLRGERRVYSALILRQGGDGRPIFVIELQVKGREVGLLAFKPRRLGDRRHPRLVEQPG